MMKTSVSETDRTVAERGRPSKRAISPKNSPGFRTAIVFSWFFTFLMILTAPDVRMYMLSPLESSSKIKSSFLQAFSWPTEAKASKSDESKDLKGGYFER